MKTFAIGDIHGSYYSLLDLFNIIPYDKDSRIVFMGDYIDRGKYSKEVVQFVKEMVECNEHAVAILGNHEDLCIGFHKGDRWSEEVWARNGAFDTLRSYYGDEKLPNRPRIDEEHLEWMEQLPLMHQDEFHIYVHAGLHPDLNIDYQIRDDLLWIREEFIRSEKDFGKIVVYGHTAYKDGPRIEDNKIGLDTGCVYGLKLTAMCMETHEIYQVPMNPKDKSDAG
jgi:serine/threonine protein phosphatase 1